MSKAESVSESSLSHTTPASSAEAKRRLDAIRDEETFRRAIRHVTERGLDITGLVETSAALIAETESSAADALQHIEKSTEAVRRSLERLKKKPD